MEVQETPFIRQLAASDRPAREKALQSLQTYLSSGRTFTDLELLKIWKGIYHTDRPPPQQRLSASLATLLLRLPPPLFLPFLSAFYTTLCTHLPSLPALRLDKYLYLLRLYVSHAFLYLAQHDWDEELVGGYLQLVEEGPLSTKGDGAGKVPDGLRYHVLDVWVDGLVGVEGWEGHVGDVMGPVRRVEREGQTRVLRGRAKEVLGDERLRGEGEGGGEGGDESEEGEFEGFGE
ncbi:hypothetical protein ACLMJK_004072 [Lecanora helva]